MGRAKSVTIRLTAKQREQLRKLTGNDHTEVLFEKVVARGNKVSAKANLARKTPLSGQLGSALGSGGSFGGVP